MKTILTQEKILKKIPSSQLIEMEMINLLSTNVLDNLSISNLKKFLKLDDKTIADILNVNLKTFQKHIIIHDLLKTNLKKEHLVRIISLYKHGEEVFGDMNLFNKWMNSNNFHFDKKPPIRFIDTNSGIEFIDNRLTGMQYGDNA